MNHGHQKNSSDKQANKVPRWILWGEGVIIWIIFACLINIYCLLGKRHCWVLLHLLFYLITKSSSLADKISQGLSWANELACLVFLRPSCLWGSPGELQGHLVLGLPPLGSYLPVQGWHPASACQNPGPASEVVSLTEKNTTLNFSALSNCCEFSSWVCGAVWNTPDTCFILFFFFPFVCFSLSGVWGVSG